MEINLVRFFSPVLFEKLPTNQVCINSVGVLWVVFKGSTLVCGACIDCVDGGDGGKSGGIVFREDVCYTQQMPQYHGLT